MKHSSESTFFISVLDINECASASIHQCPQNCENNPGSFQCLCTSGYNYNAVTNECDGKCYLLADDKKKKKG